MNKSIVIACVNCGAIYHSTVLIDFKIKDNLSVIEDNEFEIFKAGYDSANVEYESESVEELYKEFKKNKKLNQKRNKL